MVDMPFNGNSSPIMLLLLFFVHVSKFLLSKFTLKVFLCDCMVHAQSIGVSSLVKKIFVSVRLRVLKQPCT